jgi:DNA-binding GntR family transcriptional regulator
MATATGGRPKRSETHVSLITKELRRDIITGQLQPGGKLKVRQLAERFGVGLSPIRESLNRLSREWLVDHNDLRGFSVSLVSEQDLDELMKARCWLNDRALRESIAHGDSAWEESVLLAYHRLSRIPRPNPNPGPMVNPVWEAAHRVFHRNLIGGCGSRRVVDICDQLFDVADIYRHIARATPAQAERESGDEHRPIMDAALARDADRAVDLLMAHFMWTAELCREPLRRMAQGKPKRPSAAAAE